MGTIHTIHSLNRKFGFRQTEVISGSKIVGGKPVDMIHLVLKAEDWPSSRARLVPLAEYAETQIRSWEECSQENPDDLAMGKSPLISAVN